MLSKIKLIAGRYINTKGVIIISALSIAKIVTGIILLVFIVFTIRRVQKNGTGEFNGNDGLLMFLIAAESIALPIYGYFLSL